MGRKEESLKIIFKFMIHIFMKINRTDLAYKYKIQT